MKMILLTTPNDNKVLTNVDEIMIVRPSTRNHEYSEVVFRTPAGTQYLNPLIEVKETVGQIYSLILEFVTH